MVTQNREACRDHYSTDLAGDANRATIQRARTRAHDLDARLAEIIDRESQLEDVGIRRARRVTIAQHALPATVRQRG